MKCSYIHAFDNAQDSDFGTLNQYFHATRYRNKCMRFTGAVKTEDVKKWTGLWMRVDGPCRQQLQFDNMSKRPINGTTEWQSYDVILDVPENSVKIVFGVMLVGSKGRVWRSDVRFEETEEES